jgi:hypothetical protein
MSLFRYALLMSAQLLNANSRPVLTNGWPRSIAFGKAATSNPFAAGMAVVGAASANLNKIRQGQAPKLPSTAKLLTDGGDARIVCRPSGANQYGCTSVPAPAVLAFGSSTASTISPTGFAAADALRKRLKYAVRIEPPALTYERELNRVRSELTDLCGLRELSGLEIVFGASGTDLHLFASQLVMEKDALAPLIIRVEATETGRGVPDALAGCHFSDCAALGDTVISNSPLDCGRPVQILEVKCRTAEGTIRPVALIDAQVEQAVLRANSEGRRVLLTLVDVSKTGLLAPSPACADALSRRFPDAVEVLVDACQFRLAPSTLKAYLERDFLVAITGSKFITGPTFCGALLVPGKAAQRLKARTLPRTLKSYSARADWPRDWAARSALTPVANFGLLLRWEAALAEVRAFRELTETAITDFVETFANAISLHVTNNPAFEYLPAPALDRSSISSDFSWDRFPTIFSFLLLRRSASGQTLCLSQAETKRVHELLRASGSQLGQPVACGTRDGKPVSALRLCLSSRLIVDALAPEGRGSEAVIAEAVAVLKKTARAALLPLV